MYINNIRFFFHTWNMDWKLLKLKKKERKINKK